MSTFHISRRVQEILLIEGCCGLDTHSREMRFTVAKMLKEHLPTADFNPVDLFNFDLSSLLAALDDETHNSIFKLYITLI